MDCVTLFLKKIPLQRNQEGKEARRQGGSGGQEQSKKEIRKGNKHGRDGGCSKKEQPRREIRKGDSFEEKVAAATKSSPEEKS